MLTYLKIIKILIKKCFAITEVDLWMVYIISLILLNALAYWYHGCIVTVTAPFRYINECTNGILQVKHIQWKTPKQKMNVT